MVVMEKSYNPARLRYIARMAALAVCAVAAVAQVNTDVASSSAKSQLRATAVCEFNGDTPASGKFRLVPVVIYDHGEFKDAGLYLADPVPLALQTGSVYELQDAGNVKGYVTVTRAAQMQAKSGDEAWYGVGTLSKAAPDVQVAKLADKIVLPEEHRVYDPKAAEKEKHRRKHGADTGQSKPAETTTASSTGTGSSAPAPSGDEGAPTLKKAPPPKPDPLNGMNNGQPDLPPPSVGEDPNRPTMSRGKPAGAPAEVSDLRLSGPLHSLVAVSDAVNKEAHPYRFDFSAAEEKKYRGKMIALAVAELKKAHADAAQLNATQWQDVRVRAFNLSLDNVATLVLSATLPGKTEQYLTLAGRVNLEDEAQRTFFQLTDRERFDIAPRLTLVDAVDVDGDGRGELLFREQTAEGNGWAIYRATADSLTKLFDAVR